MAWRLWGACDAPCAKPQGQHNPPPLQTDAPVCPPLHPHLHPHHTHPPALTPTPHPHTPTPALPHLHTPPHAPQFSQLHCLTSLDLSGCGLVSVPAPVAALPGLQHLSLENNALANLPHTVRRRALLPVLRAACCRCCVRALALAQAAPSAAATREPPGPPATCPPPAGRVRHVPCQPQHCRQPPAPAAALRAGGAGPEGAVRERGPCGGHAPVRAPL